MPIYEYQCDQCGHQLEVLQGVSEKILTECPACHGFTLNKLMSSTSFQLKGTGWYATDFRNKGQSSDTKNSKESQEVKTSDSNTQAQTSESKPAETTAAATTATTTKTNGETGVS